MTATKPIIRYDAIIEAALNGTLQRAYAAHECGPPDGATLRKSGLSLSAAAIPTEPCVLVNGDEANLLTRQARQRVEHAARQAKNNGIELGIGDMQKRAQADGDAARLFNASRLRQFVPGFLVGVR